MELAIPTPFKVNQLTGAIYEYKLKGDVLAWHYHSAGDGHITFVLKGSVEIKGGNTDKPWVKIGVAGNFFDLPDQQSHEIIALEDGTKILNIKKGAA